MKKEITKGKFSVVSQVSTCRDWSELSLLWLWLLPYTATASINWGISSSTVMKLSLKMASSISRFSKAVRFLKVSLACRRRTSVILSKVCLDALVGSKWGGFKGVESVFCYSLFELRVSLSNMNDQAIATLEFINAALVPCGERILELGEVPSRCSQNRMRGEN